jgi:hypothetical protein
VRWPLGLQEDQAGQSILGISFQNLLVSSLALLGYCADVTPLICNARAKLDFAPAQNKTFGIMIL